MNGETDKPQTTPRDVILATLRRARQAGESHEMAAKWICEDLSKAGYLFAKKTGPLPAQHYASVRKSLGPSGGETL